MKTTLILIFCFLIFGGGSFIGEKRAQNPSLSGTPATPQGHFYAMWTDKQVELVRSQFDAAWRNAQYRFLISPDVKKPPIEFFDESPEEDCGGLAIETADNGSLIFCSSFLSQPEDWKLFLFNHEIGHEVLQHTQQLAVAEKVSQNELLKTRIRIECEANVFVGKLVNPFFASLELGTSMPADTIYKPAKERSIAVLEGKRPNCDE